MELAGVNYVKHELIKENKLEARVYQQLIFASASTKNTLVVAPTALGKTAIAILLAAYFLKIFPDRKILVLAPTKPLAAQHASRFKEFLNIEESKIALLTGTINAEKREELFKSSSIISATPQTVANDVRERKYDLSQVSLAVFDEAHRATGDYDYVYIASKLSESTRILALTASPGSEEEKIAEVCRNLRIENIEIRTERDADVRPYVKGIGVDWVEVRLPDEFRAIKNLMEKLFNDKINALKSQKQISRIISQSGGTTKKGLLALRAILIKRIEEEKAGMGGYGVELSELYSALSACAAALAISHAIELLETQNLDSFVSYLEKMSKEAMSRGASKAVRGIVRERDFLRALELARKVKLGMVHPKLEALEGVIRGIKQGKKMIVFTQYRDSAKIIAETLGKIEGVKPIRFVGQAVKEGDKGLSQKEQIEIIKRFREGEYNALVATSVAEEGLDIPAVDYVIFYEPIPSGIRAIQRRGRTGRSRIGRVIVLITKGTRDQGFYWSSAIKERRMRELLESMKKRFARGKAHEKTGQKSMEQFAAEPQKKPEQRERQEVQELYVDIKELSTELPRKLASLGIKLKPKKLLNVSYESTDKNIVIKRETVNELTKKIKENRLDKELKELEGYKRIIMLIEGAEEKEVPEEVRERMAQLRFERNAEFIFVKNEEESAERIADVII